MYYFLLVFLPLFNFFFISFFGKRLFKWYGTIFISCTMLFILLLMALYNLYYIIYYKALIILPLFSWVHLDRITDIGFELIFDPLSAIMLIVILSISFLVNVYSIGYMGQDPFRIRFFAYLSLFTFFMLLLVTAANFIVMFVGWEGVGLCSYLLISFWNTIADASRAALQAIIVNRIGDFGILAAIVLIYSTFKSLDYYIIFPLIAEIPLLNFSVCTVNVNIVSLISFCLFLGATAKSAQLGLHTWLPSAMAGPTPVSALIHAATMVTAGIFLLIRCSPILELAPVTTSCIFIVGAITCLFGALIGLVQSDLKKVIAYSTVSQLGYMAIAIGSSNYSVSIFHLTNHAFFKALLFLGAGAIIHALSSEQDIRYAGGLLSILPVTYLLMTLASLALMGLPFLTGFYSKDVIMETAACVYFLDGIFVFWLSVLTACCTAFYSIRLLYIIFLGHYLMPNNITKHSTENSLVILMPLVLLGLCSLFVGYLFSDLFIGSGSTFWLHSIHLKYPVGALLDSEFLPTKLKLLPLLFTLVGSLIAWLLYNTNTVVGFKGYFVTSYKSIVSYSNFIGLFIYNILSQRFLFDQFYNYLIVDNTLLFGYSIGFKLFDQGFLSLFGPMGITHLVKIFVKTIRFLHTGYLYHYFFIMISMLSFLFGVIYIYF